MHAIDPGRRPWAHLHRRFARLWDRSYPSASPPSPRPDRAPPRSSSSSAACSSSPPEIASSSPRSPSSSSAVAPPPLFISPSRRSWERSFVAVVSGPPPAPTMSHGPQRPPPPTGPRGGAPRPPLQPASLGQQLGQQPPPMGAAGAAAVSATPPGVQMPVPQAGGFPYRPLQPPSRQYGPSGFIPPQLMPYGQFLPPQMPASVFPPFQQQPAPPPVAAVGQGASRARKKKKNGTTVAVAQVPQQTLPHQGFQPQQVAPFVQPQFVSAGLQQGVVMYGQQPGPLQQQVLPVVSAAPVASVVDVVPVAGAAVSQSKDKSKKATVCWKCAVNTHATKDCTAQHYCLVCNNAEHPTMRCPTLRLPRPSAFTCGFGTDATLFLQLPDSVFKEHLAPTGSPTALVSIVGEPVTAAAIQSLMSRMCPTRSQWT